MKAIDKWLPIIFGCHRRNDRSFYFNGKKFPICARCTGELLGIIFALMSYYFYWSSVLINILLMIPMLVDGFIQLKTQYESNNIKRILSGSLFGYGLCNLFIQSIIFTLKLGYSYGK